MSPSVPLETETRVSPSSSMIRPKKSTVSPRATKLSLGMLMPLIILLGLQNPVATDAFSSTSLSWNGAALALRRCILLNVASIDQIGKNETESSRSNASVPKASKNGSARYAAEVDFDWQTIAESVFASDHRPIILFDGVCNLCNGGVNFAMDHDSTAKFRFASLQSNVAQSLLLREGKHPTKTQNIVLVTPQKAYFSSQAVARICAQLDMPLLRVVGHVGQITPKWLREPIYQLVSRNRFILGENESCRLDFDGIYTNRFVSDPTTTVLHGEATTTTTSSSGVGSAEES
jgi:predicted DCC family thiol-disulfide oxidoreductase YuxK